MKPYIHAKNSARRFGGVVEDYIEIHNFMDSSKSMISDNRHRSLLHHSFGIFVLEKTFGVDLSGLKSLQEKYNLPDSFIKDAIDWKQSCTTRGTVLPNSAGKMFSVRDVGEQHCLEDFSGRFIPTPQDYIQEMSHAPWMDNNKNDRPASSQKLPKTPQVLVKD